MTLTATRDGSPITTKSATQTVTVSAPAGGIPFGLFGIKPDTLASGTIWTGGSLSSKNVNNILTQLHASQIKSPHLHMWFSMTGGNEQDFMNADSSFNLQRWKDTLDKYAAPLNADGSSQYAAQLAPYMQDTTFLGIQMLDDLGNFKPDPSFAQIEAMAAHAKLRYPGITTAVRQRPTKLPAGTYTSLEAAWAQYRNNDDGMTAAQYRDAQIAAAKSRHLGLVLGMNIHDGGVPNHPGDLPSDSLLSWGQQLLAAGTSDYGCAFIMWNKDYGNLSDPNMTTIANLAKNHVASPCKFH